MFNSQLHCRLMRLLTAKRIIWIWVITSHPRHRADPILYPIIPPPPLPDLPAAASILCNAFSFWCQMGCLPLFCFSNGFFLSETQNNRIGVQLKQCIYFSLSFSDVCFMCAAVWALSSSTFFADVAPTRTDELKNQRGTGKENRR